MTREERNKIFLSAECAKKGNNSYLRQLQNGLIYIEFATLRAGTPRFVGRGCEVSPIPKTKHHEVTAFLQKNKKGDSQNENISNVRPTKNDCSNAKGDGGK